MYFGCNLPITVVFECINMCGSEWIKAYESFRSFQSSSGRFSDFFFINNYHGQMGETKQHAENKLYKIQNVMTHQR